MRSLICLLIGLIICFDSQPAFAEREIYINLWHRTLQLQDNGKVIKTYRINPGKDIRVNQFHNHFLLRC
jgi:hypothetical protein